MNRASISPIALASAALLAAGCGALKPITAPPVSGGSANFSVYASMGTSVTAGWQSGGLVDRHQRHSYAAMFARQAGVPSFTLPTVSAEGIPALLRIVSLSPLVISNAGRTAGSPTNAAQATAYHNMAVPYSILFDVADSSLYYSGLLPRPAFPFDIVVRHRGTILSEVASLQPTFVSVEYGSNEVLGAAANGSGSVNPSPAVFSALLHGTLDALQAVTPGAKMAIVTVPGIPSIPYFTTFSPYTISLSTGQPVPLIGPGGTPLSAGDFVLLNAGADMATGKGFPVGSRNYVNPAAPGTGVPLDDSEVLSASEAVSIKAAVDAYNAAITSEATARGMALVDLHGLLQTVATTGVPYQGTIYTPAFITGGLFTLDGVHPNDLADGLICNTMIDAVNATFGSSIPRLNLSEAATVTASRLGLDFGERPIYPVIEGGKEYYRSLFPPLGAGTGHVSLRR